MKFWPEGNPDDSIPAEGKALDIIGVKPPVNAILSKWSPISLAVMPLVIKTVKSATNTKKNLEKIVRKKKQIYKKSLI